MREVERYLSDDKMIFEMHGPGQDGKHDGWYRPPTDTRAEQANEVGRMQCGTRSRMR